MRPLAAVLIPLVTTLALLPAKPPNAGGSYGFLVGCQEYDEKFLRKLRFPRADMTAFAEQLHASGYPTDHVVMLHDGPGLARRYLPETDKIRAQLDLLLGGLDEDDSVVVAFAGHGVQFKGEATAYFCPVNADPARRETLIPLDEVFAKLKECKARRKLLLVDACRNDPQSELGRSLPIVKLESVTRPPSKTAVPKGLLALFSCEAGQQSYEHPDLGHGLFFHHVIEAWKGDGGPVTLDEFRRKVRVGTRNMARVKLVVLQTPAERGEISVPEEWVLAGSASAPDRPRERPAPPRTNGAVTLDLGSGVKVECVRVPAGEFMMGSPDDDKDASSDEKPRHKVRISRDFALGKTEVTIGQWKRFVAETGYQSEAEKDGEGGWGYDEANGKFEGRKPQYTWKSTGWPQTDDHPVVNVTWNDAVAFCEWASRKTGRGVKLPTEAQWEYACRAGTATRYHTGDGPASLEGYANIAGQELNGFKAASGWTLFPFADAHKFSAPAAKYKPNPLGLHDMHGNVWEWCADWYDDKYYNRSTSNDPNCTDGEQKYRVLRGGSWRNAPARCLAAYRGWNAPASRDDFLGLRVAVRLD